MIQLDGSQYTQQQITNRQIADNIVIESIIDNSTTLTELPSDIVDDITNESRYMFWYHVSPGPDGPDDSIIGNIHELSGDSLIVSEDQPLENRLVYYYAIEKLKIDSNYTLTTTNDVNENYTITISGDAGDNNPMFRYNGGIAAEDDLLWANYYTLSGDLPLQESTTVSIQQNFFGSGKQYSRDSQRQVLGDYTTTADFTTPVETNLESIQAPPSPIYYNVSMALPTVDSMNPTTPQERQEAQIQVSMCAQLVQDKLITCSSSSGWSSNDIEGCNSCFGSTDRTNNLLCENYSTFIEGGSIQTPQDTREEARNLGVCGILVSKNSDTGDPWDYIDVSIQPPDYGEGLPADSPYGGNCESIADASPNLKFRRLNRVGNSSDDLSDSLTFFKPARNYVSDIFLASADEETYGCIRDDLNVMTEDYLNLSCNTTLATPVERDKHVIINYIIHHSEDVLNASDRTKLAIMSEEELINKALSLGISFDQLNQYTKPTIKQSVRDIEDKYMCEDNITPCNPDDPDSCPNGSCGLYEKWNDLSKYYYNMSSEDKQHLLNKPQWEYVGCGLDLNYSDNSSGETVCKDKYPGLCEFNRDKCDSDNDAIRDAIRLDCPETCNVQFSNVADFETEQSGQLSICTSRGRCKWAHDMDPANLLPPCEETTSRQFGSPERCAAFNLAPPEGPSAGSCTIGGHLDTSMSSQCAEQRCLSMEGCQFTARVTSGCSYVEYNDTSIENEEECNLQNGRWTGTTSISGNCIIPESFNPDITQDDCALTGGTWRQGTDQDICEFVPDIGYIGEDPCSHIVNLDQLTEDEQLIYFHEATAPLYIVEVSPTHLEGDDPNDHPRYIKLRMNVPLSSVIENYPSDMSGQVNDKYISITGNPDHFDKMCSQNLLGKSKVFDVGTDEFGEYIVIGGPDKAYTMPLDIEQSEILGRPIIDIGNTWISESEIDPETSTCHIAGIYDISMYHENNQDGNLSLRDSCLQDINVGCTFNALSESCESCRLNGSRHLCYEPGAESMCGWGSVEDICNSIGDIDMCRRMHMDGCEWDVASEQCRLNELTDDDGNPLVSKVGCMKCGDVSTRDACHSLENCYWDIRDSDNPQCQSCSTLSDDECIYTITQGRCQHRPPDDQTTGFENLTFVQDLEDMWDIITGGDTPLIEQDRCGDNEECFCRPVRKYPFFPDWIIQNLAFLTVTLPFVIYLGYAVYKIYYSNQGYKIDNGKVIDVVIANVKDLPIINTTWMRNGIIKGMFPSAVPSISELKTINSKPKLVAAVISIVLKFGFLLATFPLTLLQGLTNTIRLNVMDRFKFSYIPKGDYLFIGAAIFNFLVGLVNYIALPAGGIALLVGVYYYFLDSFIKENQNYVKVVEMVEEVDDEDDADEDADEDADGEENDGEFSLTDIDLLTVAENIETAITAEDEVIPLDPDLIQHPKWPQTLYREEYNNMLIDPVDMDELDERRRTLLSSDDLNELEKTILSDDEILNVGKLSNLTVEPEDLDWTTRFRSFFQGWNNLVNRVGDKTIFYYVLTPILVLTFYKVFVSTKNYYQSDKTKKIGYVMLGLLLCIAAIVYGVLKIYMIEEDPPTLGEGKPITVESKCAPIAGISIDSICSEESLDESVIECPYGCYYKESDTEYTPCPDKRSLFSLGGIIDPNPRLNLPVPQTLTADWYQPDGKDYVCPPPPSHKSKFPYDVLCSSGQTRCLSDPTKNSESFLSNRKNEFCETMHTYYSNAEGDEAADQYCISNTFPTNDLTGPKGSINESNEQIHCRLEYPDFSQDTNCPFKMAATELHDFDEMSQRQPVSAWQWMYDSLFGDGFRMSEPERIAWQNEARYLIIDDDYNPGLFS